MIKKNTIENINWSSPAAIMIFLLVLFTAALRLDAAEVCEATLNCPMNYAQNDTLDLPGNIVSLSKTFKHCSPTFFDESYKPGNIDTISLFFVIDHSASMSSMDSTCIRYDLVTKLIDSLTANSPVSEIGMAVFSNQLLHSVTMDDHAVLLDQSSGFTDAFIPLTKLNSTVKGQSASEYLKSVIKLSNTENDIGFNKKLVNCYYGKSGRKSGNTLSGYNGTTDITLAFDAARMAFKSAIYPKNKQYIIFLSDGEAQNVDDERTAYINDYKKGTGLPTTFTAFWVTNNQPVPAAINTMTAAIQTNNYSSTNQYSEVWKTSGDVNELMSKLLNISTGKAFSVIYSRPVKLTINNVTTTTFDDTLAYFDNSFAFESSNTTLNASFTYHFDSPMDVDSTRNFQVFIRTVKGAKLPADIQTKCREQGSIGFFIDGKEVSGVISDDDRTIEVRYFPSETMTDNQIPIHISNAGGTDSLLVNAVRSGSYYTVQFTRESGSPIIDNLLQTSANDSVTALYQNQDFPLDIVKESRSVGAGRLLGFQKAIYLDQNADGYPDLIKVIETGSMLSAEEIALIQPYLYLSSGRAVSIKSVAKSNQGFDIVLSSSNGDERFTGVYQNEKLGIKTVSGLPGGGTFPAGTIAIDDSMAPVILSATYLNGASSQNSGTSPDTLVVKFSETCDSVTSANAFKFYDNTAGSNYSMNISLLSSGDGIQQRFIKNSTSGKTAPTWGDSIWINESASVNDIAGNIQDNPLNRRVPLEFIACQYTFTAAACPVPSDPKNDPIPLDIVNQFDDKSITRGVVVVIKSGETVLPQDTISAKISIFDPLGNAVVKDDRCAVSKDNGKLLYRWKGTNRNGRFVGDGTYIAVVKVKVSNGVSRTIKARIGILYK